MFEYLHFVCESSELQAELNRLGGESWRLHTCEPLVEIHDDEEILRLVVVMDRIVLETNKDECRSDELDAMAVRG